jgi:hypothetical protein
MQMRYATPNRLRLVRCGVWVIWEGDDAEIWVQGNAREVLGEPAGVEESDLRCTSGQEVDC